MVREDWAQDGTAMREQSAVIRSWLGEPPYLVAVKDAGAFQKDRPAGLETATYIAPEAADRRVFSIRELAGLAHEDEVIDHAVVILHPYDQKDLDALRRAVSHDRLMKVFVMIWSPREVVRTWLDGLGAINLDTGEALPDLDPVMVEAGKSIVNEEYNGLATGHGKDAVVQLVLNRPGFCS